MPTIGALRGGRNDLIYADFSPRRSSSRVVRHPDAQSIRAVLLMHWRLHISPATRRSRDDLPLNPFPNKEATEKKRIYCCGAIDHTICRRHAAQFLHSTLLLSSRTTEFEIDETHVVCCVNWMSCRLFVLSVGDTLFRTTLEQHHSSHR